MRSKITIYGVLLGIMIILFVLMELALKEQTNWSLNLNPLKKSPYGTYVIHKSIGDLFPQHEVKDNKRSINTFLKDSTTNTNLICIQAEILWDESNTSPFLEYIRNGNRAFISTHYLPSSLSDTLGIEIDDKKNPHHEDINRIEGVSEIAKIKSERIHFISASLDHFEYEELGYNGDGSLNFISIKHGSGILFLHSSPLAFANINILEDNSISYAEECIKNLPEKNSIYDISTFVRSDLVRSKMHYILSSDGFRQAYYLALVLLILFVVFYGKRRQRIIPEIQPLENNSLKLTSYVSNLYLHNRSDIRQRNNTKIAHKIIRHFHAYALENWRINTFNNSEKTILQLASRANISNKEAKQYIEMSSFLINSESCTNEALFQLNSLYEKMKQHKKENK